MHKETQSVAENMHAREKYVLSMKHPPTHTHMHILACQIILTSGQAAFFELVAMAAPREKWPSTGGSYRRLQQQGCSSNPGITTRDGSSLLHLM